MQRPGCTRSLGWERCPLHSAHASPSILSSCSSLPFTTIPQVHQGPILPSSMPQHQGWCVAPQRAMQTGTDTLHRAWLCPERLSMPGLFLCQEKHRSHTHLIAFPMECVPGYRGHREQPEQTAHCSAPSRVRQDLVLMDLHAEEKEKRCEWPQKSCRSSCGMLQNDQQSRGSSPALSHAPKLPQIPRSRGSQHPLCLISQGSWFRKFRLNWGRCSLGDASGTENAFEAL